MDGYENEDIIKKFCDMQELFDIQNKLSDDLSIVTEEMGALPEIPRNMEKWFDSISDINNNNNFTLASFKKMFVINSKYNKLMEQREDNSQKIKILVIDNLIDSINKILNEKV